MPERSPDPWRIIWRFFTSDSVLVILLLALAASVTLTAYVPQRPTSDADYARWLSQMQARFAEATSMVRALGVLDVTNSPGFRALLALLAGCLLLRFIERGDQLRQGRGVVEPDEPWREVSAGGLHGVLDRLRRRRYRTVDGSSFYQVDRWPWSDLSLLAAHSGALILLLGLLFSYLWGWQIEGVVLQNGQRLALPGGDDWVALTEEGDKVRHSSGVITFVEKRGPGVHVQAIDGEGEALQLQLTAGAEASVDLLISVIGDRYFAVPEADLIVRLTPRSDEPYARIDAQVYRSPPGEIIAEEVTAEGGGAGLTIEDVTLEFTPAPYAQITVGRNPGRWPAALGLILLMVGLAGNLVWPGRRFWLREHDEAVEAAGPLPPALLPAEEGA